MPTLKECRDAVLDALADGHPNPEGYMEWFESQTEQEQIKIGCAVLFGVPPEQVKTDHAPTPETPQAETPRTNDKQFSIQWRDGAYYLSQPNIGCCEVVPADFARQLERELAQTKHKLFIEEENRNQLAILGHENSTLRTQLAEAKAGWDKTCDRLFDAANQIISIREQLTLLYHSRALAALHAASPQPQPQNPHPSIDSLLQDVHNDIMAAANVPGNEETALAHKITDILSDLKPLLTPQPAGEDTRILDWLDNRIVKVHECMACTTPKLFEHVPAGYGRSDYGDLRATVRQAMRPTSPEDGKPERTQTT